MSENLLKKISVKGVCGEIVAPKIGETREIMVVMGYAKSKETKPTSFGDSTAFHGDFKAIDIATGEEFRAGTCYLPDVASSLLANALEGTSGVIEFGFSVSIVGVKGRNPSEGDKYEYRVKPLLPAAENDPMLALTSKMVENETRKAAPKLTKVK